MLRTAPKRSRHGDRSESVSKRAIRRAVPRSTRDVNAGNEHAAPVQSTETVARILRVHG